MLAHPNMQTATAYATATQGACPPTEPAEPVLTETLNRVGRLIESADAIRDRLNRIEARVFGAPLLDGNAQTCAPKAVPSGAAGVLRDRLGELDALLIGASVIIDRLDNIA